MTPFRRLFALILAVILILIASATTTLSAESVSQSQHTPESVFGDSVGQAKARYASLAAIGDLIDGWIAEYPGIVTFENPEKKDHKSVEGRDLWLLKLTNNSRVLASNGRPKARILILSGEHPRELFPVETVITFITTLLQASELGCFSNEHRYADYLLDNCEIYVIPMLNPDGRARLEKSGDWCWRGNAHNVDLNRNMPWHFVKAKGSNGGEDDVEDFGGAYPFSEPETRFLNSFLSSLASENEDFRLHGFLSVHSGAREIICGFSDSKSRQTGRVPEHFEDVMRIAAGLNRSTDGYFTAAGPGAQLLEYAADGTIIDYVAGAERVPFALAVETFGTGGSESDCFDAFNPPPGYLREVVERVLPMYSAFLEMLVRRVVGVKPPPYVASQSQSQHQSVSEIGGTGSRSDDADPMLCRGSRRVADIEHKLAVLKREWDL